MYGDRRGRLWIGSPTGADKPVGELDKTFTDFLFSPVKHNDSSKTRIRRERRQERRWKEKCRSHQ